MGGLADLKQPLSTKGKAYTTYTQELANLITGKPCMITATSSTGRISVTLRNLDARAGVVAELTAAQALELALDLIERADEINLNNDKKKKKSS